MPNIETARPQVLASRSYNQLDGIVKASLEQAMEFMMALSEIKRRKLYTEGGFTTWADYCKTRLNWTPQWANSQIQIAQLQQRHGNMSGRAALALQHIDEDKQAEVVKIARERQGSDITAPMIQDVAEEVTSMQGGKAEGGSGNTPKVSPLWHDTILALRAALVTAGKLIESDQAVHIDRNYVMTMIKNAGVEVSQGKPHALCYGCKGRGCDRCRDAGLMTAAQWKNRPIEFQAPDDEKWVI
jgi:hypothetical protein